MLSIKNLHASIDGKEILKGINLEIKATYALAESHYLQTKNYCACSKQKLGVLVNFGESSLIHKRVLSGY